MIAQVYPILRFSIATKNSGNTSALQNHPHTTDEKVICVVTETSFYGGGIILVRKVA
jgi:hypothetical protein